MHPGVASGMHAPWGGLQPACLKADMHAAGDSPDSFQCFPAAAAWLLAACRLNQLVLPAAPETSGLLDACRNGHNELEDPSVTLPLTYQAVANHPPVAQLYSSDLLQQGVVTEADVKGWQVTPLTPYRSIATLLQAESFSPGRSIRRGARMASHACLTA